MQALFLINFLWKIGLGLESIPVLNEVPLFRKKNKLLNSVLQMYVIGVITSFLTNIIILEY